jgi:hypothetical protein
VRPRFLPSRFRPARVHRQRLNMAALDRLRADTRRHRDRVGGINPGSHLKRRYIPVVYRDERLITIARFKTSFEASVLRGALEAIGIPAFVPGEAQGSFSRNRGNVPQAEVQVFESDHSRAVAEVRRMEMKLVDPASD